MSENKFHVAINGRELAETFDDEESANTFAAQKRGTRENSQAPDMSKKIAVYQKGTARHAKAIAKGIAPKPDDAKPAPPPAKTEQQPQETKSDEPPKADAKKK